MFKLLVGTTKGAKQRENEKQVLAVHFFRAFGVFRSCVSSFLFSVPRGVLWGKISLVVVRCLFFGHACSLTAEATGWPSSKLILVLVGQSFSLPGAFGLVVCGGVFLDQLYHCIIALVYV